MNLGSVMNENRVMLPMNQISTLNYLVLYLYNETQLMDTVLIQNAIDTNHEIAETYNDLLAAKALVHETLMTPSQKSIQTILNYSKITAPLMHS